MKITTTRNQTLAALALALALAMAILGLTSTPATAQMPFLAIEFNQDDEDGFDLWPSAFTGTASTANFTTDPVATSGMTTVTVTTNTGFGIPANRGNLVDGTPAGFTFAELYQDLLHASSPTGFFTLDFSGLNPNQLYQFTLYAWDPGATDASDKEWTVTGGTGDPSVASVNFQDPLVDNESFALVFDITTTATGTFQLTNTNGLPQSAINGFTLTQLGPTVPLAITAIDYAPADGTVTLSWNAQPGAIYSVFYARDPGNLQEGESGDGDAGDSFEDNDDGGVDLDPEEGKITIEFPNPDPEARDLFFSVHRN